MSEIDDLRQQLADARASIHEAYVSEQQELKGRLKADRERNDAYRMLSDLTPGGSEFAGSPGYCFRWLQRHMAETLRLLVKATLDRNVAEARAEIAENECARLRVVIEETHTASDYARSILLDKSLRR